MSDSSARCAPRRQRREAAWSALYSTKSYPFDPLQDRDGKPGKIAVKVINHYGDEVPKVYNVQLTAST